ncbi:MAG: antitoxin VapB7 [Myxococcales bacterium]
MSMSLDRRLQILMDADRHDRLLAVAQDRGISVAMVVREAIDRGLPATEGHRRAAGRRILDAPEMPVPGIAELRAELDALRGRHA